MRQWVQRSPLIAFFTLAFLFTWALLPLARESVGIGILSLFGPAVAAVLTAAAVGHEALSALKRRALLWRVKPLWYLLALLIPFAISLLRTAIEILLDVPGQVRVQEVNVLALIVFVMVYGEELGWRGFAMPRLHARFGWWASSALLGALWALWHLPLFYMPTMPQYQHPFLPYVGYLIALSVLLAWITQRGSGSVIVATVFHGAVNTFAFVNDGATDEVRGWTNFIAYGAVAFALGFVVTRGASAPKAG